MTREIWEVAKAVAKDAVETERTLHGWRVWYEHPTVTLPPAPAPALIPTLTPTPAPTLTLTRYEDRSDGGRNSRKKRGDIYFQRQRLESAGAAASAGDGAAAAAADGVAAAAAAGDGSSRFDFRHPRPDGEGSPRPPPRGGSRGAPSPHALSDPTYRKVLAMRSLVWRHRTYHRCTT